MLPKFAAKSGLSANNGEQIFKTVPAFGVTPKRLEKANDATVAPWTNN
jgi:hypothetical protein